MLMLKKKNMTVTEAFGDVAGMIAQMNPEKVVALKASKQMSEQVEKLVVLKKEGTITLEQSTELERFLALDLFISLAKARARTLMAQ
jgi:GTP-dependent phosphoenolpyruvate carboxykinase